MERGGEGEAGDAAARDDHQVIGTKPVRHSCRRVCTTDTLLRWRWWVDEQTVSRRVERGCIQSRGRAGWCWRVSSDDVRGLREYGHL